MKVANSILTEAFNEKNSNDAFDNAQDRFNSGTEGITSLIKLENVSGDHTAQWEWYTPTGKLYTTSEPLPVSISVRHYVPDVNIWHKLSVVGDNAETLKGKWKVVFKLDGEVREINKFEINTTSPIKRFVENDTAPIIDVDTEVIKTKMKNKYAVAVVIGNSDYKYISEVKYAKNDAITMKKYLIETLGYREKNIIFRTNITKSDFNEIFGIKGQYRGELFRKIKPDVSDIFIYYSGHGGPDVSMAGKVKDPFFIPYDCKPTAVALNGYPLSVFYENLSKLKARKTTIILDACFSGADIYKESSVVGIRVNKPVVKKNNMVCMASSKPDQVSNWHNKAKHGLFTYYFLLGLRGQADANKDKKLTFKEIYKFVSDSQDGVPDYAWRNFLRAQTPMIQGAKSNLESVFVNYNK